MKTKRYTDIDNSCLLEVRRSGHSVTPPSVHTSGEPIAWSNDTAVAEIADAELERICDRIAAATLLARHWPAEGSRQDAALHLSGALLTRGYSRIDAEQLVSAIVSAAGDGEPQRRLEAVASTEKAVGEGVRVTSWGRLAGLVGTDVVGRLKMWLPPLSAAADGEPGLPAIAVNLRLRE
jgi:putative DNA primase/helicase